MSTINTRYAALLEQTLGQIAEQFYTHGDVAPAHRFRCEGMLNAGLQLGLIDAALVQGWDTRLQTHSGAPETRMGVAVDAEHNTATLYCRVARAPVFPSR